MATNRSAAAPPAGPAGTPSYRTGAVARMLRMPAGTLRVWERRYRVASPATTLSGHRQYSAADVQRLAVLRQLTLLGHPIGSLAALDIKQLKQVASTHAAALTSAPIGLQNRSAPRRFIAVGAGAPTPATRRYDDATLADLAGLSSTIACECPRHLAEILMQLSHFEAYSGQCERLDASDAALHAYLGQVAGAARSLFEAALERVAVHEGLVLP